LPATPWAAAATKSKAKQGVWSAAAVAAGVAAHYRMTNAADTEREEGTVGQGSGDLSLDNTNIAVGQTVTINTFTRTSWAMIVLASTASKLQLVTSAAGAISVDGAYVDRDLTTITAPTDDVGEIDVAITTATTTDLLAAPAANHRRNVRHLTVRNTHATVANTCTLQKIITATVYEKMKFTLQPGEYAVIPESGTPFVYDVGGGVKTAIAAPSTRTVLTAGTAATYTTPVGCRAIEVECIGGGGAGGGSASVASAGGAGGGGGSGGYTRKLFAPPAATYLYTIGAAGAPGVAGANNGGAGGDTTFGTLTAKGGSGGIAAAAAAATRALGGAGGIAGSGGDLNAPGDPGRAGVVMTAALVGTGAGGSNAFGGGAPGISAQGAGTGAVANTGSGGSGGAMVSAGAAVAGGAGGSGVIVVTEYY
jgi:hypothetical protein